MKRTPIRRVNPKRRAKLHARNFGGPAGDKDEWVRAQPCEVTGADPLGWPIEAAHMDARGMGGCGGDYRALVPLVRWVHIEFDGALNEAQFAAKYGRTRASVRAMAPVYHQRYEEGS